MPKDLRIVLLTLTGIALSGCIPVVRTPYYLPHPTQGGVGVYSVKCGGPNEIWYVRLDKESYIQVNVSHTTFAHDLSDLTKRTEAIKVSVTAVVAEGHRLQFASDKFVISNQKMGWHVGGTFEPFSVDTGKYFHNMNTDQIYQNIPSQTAFLSELTGATTLRKEAFGMSSRFHVHFSTRAQIEHPSFMPNSMPDVILELPNATYDGRPFQFSPTLFEYRSNDWGVDVFNC